MINKTTYNLENLLINVRYLNFIYHFHLLSYNIEIVPSSLLLNETSILIL